MQRCSPLSRKPATQPSALEVETPIKLSLYRVGLAVVFATSLTLGRLARTYAWPWLARDFRESESMMTANSNTAPVIM